jgi:hypothetical protein
VREIGRRHGVSHTGIRKKAKEEGWQPGFHSGFQSGFQSGLHHAEGTPETGFQSDVETTVQTKPADVDKIINAIERTYATAAQPKPDDDEFKWNVDNPDVLLWDRPSIALYYNPMDQIVIRQRARWPHEDEDPYICIDLRDVQVLIEKLHELAND